MIGDTSDNSDPQVARRVDLVLQQLDALPTLNVVALRLLQLTTSDETRADEVITLVSSDPALCSKILKLCSCHDRGRASNVTTIDRAVLMLGFDAVRSAVLSVQVFEMFDRMTSVGGERVGAKLAFDREMYWQHSLAVATVAELISEASRLRHTISASEAFIGGLLHDLGQLALHVVLPKSFDRVCELAAAHGVTLDTACRKIVGIDTHTAGKRVAERWQLPETLRDTMWLNDQPIDSLPALEHRAMIGLVTVADAIVRAQHICPVGHEPRGEDIAAMCEQIGVSPDVIAPIVENLPDEVARRASLLGLDAEHSRELLMSAVLRANEVLGRLNSDLRRSARAARRQARALDAITRFHRERRPDSPVVSVLGSLSCALAEVYGGSFFSVLYRAACEDPWTMYRFAGDGRLIGSDLIDVESDEIGATTGDVSDVTRQVVELLPDLCARLTIDIDPAGLRLLPLECGWGIQTVVLHDSTELDLSEQEHLTAVTRTLGAAVAAATQFEGAKGLSEQLAAANRALIAAQDALTTSQTMVALGELAAGAAHEMNNPLTVISGRSQILVHRLRDQDELRPMAEQIALQSHRLSDMVTALRTFAEPAPPQVRSVDVSDVVLRVVEQISGSVPNTVQIDTRLASDLPEAHIDSEQIGCALAELVRNAVESDGSTHVELRVQIDPLDDRLMLQVIDDGAGLGDDVLAHAFDPFFSAKPAGRQPGLGLSRAQRIVDGHGGRITLENRPQGGAVATIRLSRWRGEEAATRKVA